MICRRNRWCSLQSDALLDSQKQKRPGLSTQPPKTLNRYRSQTSSARLRDLLLEHRLADLLLDRALEVQRLRRQVFGFRLQQKRVEAAIVVDAFQRIGRDAQAHVAAERIRDEGDVDQVRQEPALGLDIGVAHLVARQRALGRQFAAPRHCRKSSSIPGLGCAYAATAGVQNHVHFQERRTYRANGPSGQGFQGHFAGFPGPEYRGS